MASQPSRPMAYSLIGLRWIDLWSQHDRRNHQQLEGD
jgi:hypothetical protein